MDITLAVGAPERLRIVRPRRWRFLGWSHTTRAGVAVDLTTGGRLSQVVAGGDAGRASRAPSLMLYGLPGTAAKRILLVCLGRGLRISANEPTGRPWVAPARCWLKPSRMTPW